MTCMSAYILVTLFSWAFDLGLTHHLNSATALYDRNQWVIDHGEVFLRAMEVDVDCRLRPPT